MKKILVVRFSSIGDIVLTSPIVRGIKKQLQAEVHFLSKKKFTTLISANPYIDKIWGIEKEVKEVIPQLKAEKFDFIVDLHHNLRSFQLKRKLGLPSASFPKLNLQKWLLTQFKINKLPPVHIVDRYFQATQALGVKPDKEGLDFFIPADTTLPFDLPPTPYVAFAIGGTYSTKRLPNHRIIELCNQINKPVLLLGGPEDQQNASIIIKELKDIHYDYCGQLTIHQSALVLQQSSWVISHDTGLMHIASALKKPIYSIWGNTIPDFGMYPYFGSQKNLNISLEVKKLSCRPCSKLGKDQCPKGHFKCMETIDFKPVIDSII